MRNNQIFCAGITGASLYAATYLRELNLPVVNDPDESVGHLLLDIPSLNSEGHLRGGGSVDKLLGSFTSDAVIYGGNLIHPSFSHYQTVDFLQDPSYLAENAYITAECALDVAFPYLNVTLRNCPVLIIGWGRIGKCLGRLLKSIGADVTIAARKDADRAIIHALGYHAADTSVLEDTLAHYRLIFNTVPCPILNAAQMESCHPDCVKIELASSDGLEGDDIIIARGLPGIHMPESSGKLIAQTFIKYYQKEETI